LEQKEAQEARGKHIAARGHGLSKEGTRGAHLGRPDAQKSMHVLGKASTLRKHKQMQTSSYHKCASINVQCPTAGWQRLFQLMEVGKFLFDTLALGET